MMVKVKVSAASARQRFHGCTPEYIANVCKASCCRSSTSPSGINVAIRPHEIPIIEEHGGKVVSGMLQSVNKRCPFQGETNLCGLHNLGVKPFGCRASPFTLNPQGTLIVRNRYRLLKCYKDDRDGPAQPAYIAFRGSIDDIFGAEEAARICAHLEAGGGDLDAAMPTTSWEALRGNSATRAMAADPNGQLFDL